MSTLQNFGKRTIRPQVKKSESSEFPSVISQVSSEITKKPKDSEKEKFKPYFLKFKRPGEQFAVEFEREKHTLVLDLDETLIHASLEPFTNASQTLNVKMDGKSYTYYVAVRPGLKKFLKEASKYYNICIYTSSVREYAMTLVEETGIKEYLFQLYCREACKKYSEDLYVKNIFELGFPSSSTILIDDFVLQMRNQPSNTLILKKFTNDMADKELIKLIPFLEYLASSDTVTPVLQKLYEFAEMRFQTKEQKISSLPPLGLTTQQPQKPKSASRRNLLSIDLNGKSADNIFKIKETKIYSQTPTQFPKISARSYQ